MAVYAFSDINWNLKIWEKIKKYIQPNDVCYILGDLIGQGENSYIIAKEALQDSRFVYLLGDKEQQFINGATCDNIEVYIFAIANSIENCFVQWEADGSSSDFIEKLKHLEPRVCYNNANGYKLFMSHYGWNINEEGLNLNISNNNGNLGNLFHVNEKTISIIPDNVIMIHGHLPVSFFEIDEPCWYDDGIKLDICAGKETNSIFLVNLDNFHCIKVLEKGEDVVYE